MLSPDPALRHRHSKEEWRRLIDEFQDSGLSRQKFCASLRKKHQDARRSVMTIPSPKSKTNSTCGPDTEAL